jgi:uncharacterized repeat protein (TIGR03803 family)
MNKLTISFLAITAAALAVPAMAQESVLYSFNPEADGNPEGRLLLVGKDTLFGTTYEQGGSPGTVFELKRSGNSWTESTLVTFDGTDGLYPAAGLIADANGNLYGTTSSDGTYNGGTVFELTNTNGTWSLQTRWYFGNTATHDGIAPTCDLLMDSTGAIYGTTEQGGTSNNGTVFKLTNSGGTWTESVLYNFAGGSDGDFPVAGLAMDSSGALYGTTYYGGGSATCNIGCGTVFELAPNGKDWTESVLHAFGNGTDGLFPGYGQLVVAPSGALYGTTGAGGTDDWGLVYELTPSGGKWKEKIIHNFGGSGDGLGPDSGLLKGQGGAMFGTTELGGANGGGTVYALTKANGGWTEDLVTSFPNFTGDGFYPHAGVILDKKSGMLFGTTSQGGTDGWGAVYQVAVP